MWAATEQYVREAAWDVHEVIAWAEKEGQARSAYVHAVRSDLDGRP